MHGALHFSITLAVCHRTVSQDSAVSLVRAFSTAWANAFTDSSWSLVMITFQKPRRSKSFSTTVALSTDVKFPFQPLGVPTCTSIVSRTPPARAPQCHVHLRYFLILEHKKNLQSVLATGICSKEHSSVFLCGCDLPRLRTHVEHQSLHARCDTSCASIISCVGWVLVRVPQVSRLRHLLPLALRRLLNLRGDFPEGGSRTLTPPRTLIAWDPTLQDAHAVLFSQKVSYSCHCLRERLF